MSDFKPGDRVVVANVEADDQDLGRHGTIFRVVAKSTIQVLLDGDPGQFTDDFADSELAPELPVPVNDPEALEAWLDEA